MKEEDIYSNGRKIAEEITSVMGGDVCDSENLDRWLLENKFSTKTVDRLTNEDTLEDMCQNFSQDKSNAISRFSTELNRRNGRRIVLKRVVASVAAAAVVLSAMIYNYGGEKEVVKVAQSDVVVVKNDADASKPILITSDGSTIDLTQVSVIENGTAQAKGDSLNYERKIDAGKSLAATTYNKLVLPEKYTYVVTLSDGTKVHLNSNSTLEYPTIFASDKREVVLTGEAYFDVSKNTGCPFIVKVGDTKVKVYGTKFNVNAYDIKSVKTALITGSVGVSYKGQSDVMVKPGQMLTINVGNEVSCLFSGMNINKYEAWLNGYFRCDDEDVAVILEDISRWYGVDFQFEYADSRKVRLSASIDRTLPIEEVIGLLQESSTIRITKKGGNKYLVR